MEVNNNNSNSSLYEILVPYCDNAGNVWPIEHHWGWDVYVRKFSTNHGQTILRSAKGYWQDEQKTHTERMIPVRLHCTAENIHHIAMYSLKYYKQKAIMYYLLSDKVTVVMIGDEAQTESQIQQTQPTQEVSTDVGLQRAVPSSTEKISAETKSVIQEIKHIQQIQQIQQTK